MAQEPMCEKYGQPKNSKGVYIFDDEVGRVITHAVLQGSQGHKETGHHRKKTVTPDCADDIEGQEGASECDTPSTPYPDPHHRGTYVLDRASPRIFDPTDGDSEKSKP